MLHLYVGVFSKPKIKTRVVHKTCSLYNSIWRDMNLSQFVSGSTQGLDFPSLYMFTIQVNDCLPLG